MRPDISHYPSANQSCPVSKSLEREAYARLLAERGAVDVTYLVAHLPLSKEPLPFNAICLGFFEWRFLEPGDKRIWTISAHLFGYRDADGAYHIATWRELKERWIA